MVELLVNLAKFSNILGIFVLFKKALQQKPNYGSTVDWYIQFSVWHNSSRPNRSIILHFYEDFGELQATVSCTVLVKMKFWFSLKSTFTKAHNMQKVRQTWPHHKSALLYCRCYATAGASWIFHMPSTSFFPVPQKSYTGCCAKKWPQHFFQ